MFGFSPFCDTPFAALFNKYLEPALLANVVAFPSPLVRRALYQLAAAQTYPGNDDQQYPLRGIVQNYPLRGAA